MIHATAQMPPSPPSPVELAEWWDIVNAIAQSVGAIGTAGALLIAASAYRRQRWDQRRALATQVRFTVHMEGSLVHMMATNYGPFPVRDAFIMQGASGRLSRDFTPREWEAVSAVRAGGDALVFVYSSEGLVTGVLGEIGPGQTVTALQEVQGKSVGRWTSKALVFTDHQGLSWTRPGRGGLYPFEYFEKPWQDRYARWLSLRSRRYARRLTAAYKRVDAFTEVWDPARLNSD